MYIGGGVSYGLWEYQIGRLLLYVTLRWNGYAKMKWIEDDGSHRLLMKIVFEEIMNKTIALYIALIVIGVFTLSTMLRSEAFMHWQSPMDQRQAARAVHECNNVAFVKTGVKHRFIDGYGCLSPDQYERYLQEQIKKTQAILDKQNETK